MDASRAAWIKTASWMIVAALLFGGETSAIALPGLTMVPESAVPPAGCDLFATQVRPFDDDSGQPLTYAYLYGFAFADANLNGLPDGDERAYYDSDGSGTVSLDDVRISPDPGTQVGGVDGDLGTALSFLDGIWAFLDANGDAAFNGADALYWDHDFDGSLSVGDIRLTDATASLGGPVEAGDAGLGSGLMWMTAPRWRSSTSMLTPCSTAATYSSSTPTALPPPTAGTCA